VITESAPTPEGWKTREQLEATEDATLAAFAEKSGN